MKRKYLAFVLGMALTAAPLSVSAQEAEETDSVTVEDTEAASEGEEEEEVLTGEIVSLEEDSITIALGTLKDAEEESVEEETDSPIELDGEERTVFLTEDTEFFRLIADPENAEEPAGTGEEQTETEAAQTETKTETETESEASEETESLEEAEETEAMEEEELQSGDFVRIALDEEGNAVSVTVCLAKADDLETEESEAEETETAGQEASEESGESTEIGAESNTVE